MQNNKKDIESHSQKIQRLEKELAIKYKEKSIKELMQMRESFDWNNENEYDIGWSLWQVVMDKFESKAIHIDKDPLYTDNPAGSIWIAENQGSHYWLDLIHRDCSLPYEIPKYLYEALFKFKSEKVENMYND